MNGACRSGASLALLLVLSGCAGYSDLVNSHAPAKQDSVVTVGRGDAEPYATGQSPFCAVPPPIREVYMVMPEQGGKAGTVSVTFNDGRQQVLHGDYHAMTLAGEEAQTYRADRAEMEDLFGNVVSALPPPPFSTILYFLLGKDELTPESSLEAEQVFARIAGRPSPEIHIVGHTDTIGPDAENEALSNKRAQKIRWRLVELGVPPADIQAIGVGERELVVQTPDNTKEPKNRCVEISVR